jgi:predicted DNA-binding transcriptional regulator AlpA
MPNFNEPSADGCPLPVGMQASPRFDRERIREIVERYIGRRELRAMFPVSDMTIWRWTRDPAVAFPKPRKLGRNGRNFWWLPEILEWERHRATNSPVTITPRLKELSAEFGHDPQLRPFELELAPSRRIASMRPGDFR